jgi:hypothetical protein
MRNYWVKMIKDDGTDTAGLFVKARSPKLAVDKVADRLSPIGDYERKFKVYTLTDGCSLFDWRSRKYSAFFRKHVSRVERCK